MDPNEVDRLRARVAELEAALTRLDASAAQASSSAGEQPWLTRIAELTPDIIFVRDLVDDRDTAANRAIGEALGYSASEIETLDEASLVHPGDRGKRTDRLRRMSAAEDGEVVRLESRMKHKSGEWRWFLHRWLVLRRDVDGTPRLGLCMATDITENKQAEAALRESQAQLAVTVEAIGDGLITCDSVGRIRLFNRAAEELSGRARDDVVGELPDRVLELVDVTGQPVSIEAILDDARALGEVRIPEPLTLRARRSIEHQIRLRATALRDPGGRIAGVLLVLRDVTDRSRLEQQVRQAQKMETVGRLAGGIAHDFNNLLAGILGYAELAQLRLSDGNPLEQPIGRIIDAGRRAADLTEKLLAISRKGKRTSEHVDLHALVGEALGILERTVDRRIELGASLEAKQSVVRGDPTQLQSALLNLALNARDAISGGGRIRFATRNEQLTARACRELGPDLSPGRLLVVEVTDDGVGIPAEDLQRIFDPYYTTKAIGEGAGLGLAAVYGCVTEHHGAIHVDSEPGSGTTISIYLPLAERQVPVPDAAYEVVLQGEGTVLVVDDEPMIREMGQEMLRELGYEVLTARDGVEALEVYTRERERIDMVLLDLVMPRLDGHDTFYRLRRLDPEVRVLLTSGFNFDANVEELLEDGAVGFVHKPFRAGELSWRIAEALS